MWLGGLNPPWGAAGIGRPRGAQLVQGFDVGAERFSWQTGSGLSAAALCNLAASKQPILEGMKVEVHWFEDSAQGNEHRVVVLRKL